jgi:hypothetical protein
MLGAYYFDGWNGKTMHITELLKGEYSDRMPVWGWKADTVEIMERQIDYCADHAIGFWSFCWYYPEQENKETPLNNALELYLQASNRERLKFYLHVCNHRGFLIGPDDWDVCCEKWIELFQEPTYMRVKGKPYLSFHIPYELERSFGGADGVRKAFDLLREKAKAAGLGGVTIAGCARPGGQPDFVRAGYTFLTGYNYNNTPKGENKAKPFRSLIEANRKIFAEFAEILPLPYIPVITAGWDRRPWEEGVSPMALPPEQRSGWYPDRSPELVEEFVRMGICWLDAHPYKTPAERLLLLYAWNENGEGAYLTPTESDGLEYLKAVQRAVCGGCLPSTEVKNDEH